MTYLLLNIIFLFIVMSILVLSRKLRWNSAMTWTMIVLIVATAIFDSLIVGVEIVAYDEAKILGLRVGQAPIEDFFYAILAGIIIPTIWNWRLSNDGES